MFARARGFGMACAVSEGMPIAAHVPFLIREQGQGRIDLEFHVSRANPIATCADGTFDWLLAVQGPDAYVSADWYVTPDQVPTWLYEAVHFTGPVKAMPIGRTDRHADDLSAEFERRLLPKPPWTSDKMRPERREGLKNGIVGLSMQVLKIEGQRKLNQHKTDPDHVAVADALAGHPTQSARELAGHMRGQRPGLAYKADAVCPRIQEET